MKEYTAKDVLELIALMEKMLPGFAIEKKADSWLQRAIGWLLRPINKSYMTSYATTMFGKIWMPTTADDWSPAVKYQLLRHEFIHLLDAKKYPIIFQLSYLFWLPAIFTMRSTWELRGFTQTMLVEYEQTGDISMDTVDWIVRQFTTSRYFWMNPFEDTLRADIALIKAEIKARIVSGITYPHPLTPP